MWKNNQSKCITNTFNNKDEVKLFFTDLFANINSEQEYNIYVHQINGYYCNTSKKHGTSLIKQKVSAIIRNGFSISKYSTISGTSMLIGSTNDLNVDNILNYEYYKNEDCVALCIIAIPKYININGTKIEYSSFQGKDAWHFPEDLTAEYKKMTKFKPELHHYKCSLFDSIKQYNELPNCYMLGILQLETSQNKYSFIKSINHLSNLKKEEKNQHDSHVENLIKNLYDKYNTSENKEIIVNSYMENQIYYDEVEVFEI